MAGTQAFDPNEHPHRRFNPLKDEWVLVSPHRMKRPWNGQQEPTRPWNRAQNDMSNPLVPGATRGNGIVTPNYKEPYTFTNDFPALVVDGPCDVGDEDKEDGGLFKTEAVHGTCRVVCFHPTTWVTLALMTVAELRGIVDEWVRQTEQLGQEFKWVQVFENKGAMMGCSNPHPHCQIWAMSSLPTQAATKDRTQRAYLEKTGENMLVKYVQRELVHKERIVVENEHFVVLVPYWACWPYETMILPKRHVLRLTDLTDAERDAVAAVMKQLCIIYDNLFECNFPYVMGWHGAPFGGREENVDHWQLHATYMPPLLRSSSVKKHMVGFEMLGESQRDLTAEQAAAKLRALPICHYTERTHKKQKAC